MRGKFLFFLLSLFFIFSQTIAFCEELSTLEALPEEETVVIYEPRLKFDFGLSGGLFSEGSFFRGEFKYGLPYIFGPAKSEFRILTGLAQSEDISRRFIPLCIDGILSFPPGWLTGVNNYIGLGINYVIYMTGRKSGGLGWQIFYGVEDEGFGGKVFGEIGFAELNSDNYVPFRGTLLMVGLRKEINI